MINYNETAAQLFELQVLFTSESFTMFVVGVVVLYCLGNLLCGSYLYYNLKPGSLTLRRSVHLKP